ncbi:phenylalanine--tRNA ligase beta subunit-related protein [Plantactinospora siamensis]|uniref:phenylalanine--tRNA ligase n=1 Tax=Plantactinospora siamensis TaxID=555372 RepID=A0ABV6P0D9_9ACTN
MLISLDWIRDHVELPAGIDPAELAHRLTLATVEVEDVLRIDGDVLLDIDNKSLTNRPDLWGHAGIARELAAVYGVPLRPAPAADRPPPVDGLAGAVDPAVCLRYAAVALSIAPPPAVVPHPGAAPGPASAPPHGAAPGPAAAPPDGAAPGRATAPAAPDWLRERLARVGAPAGGHPLVDLADYVMYATGQPVRPYDADALGPPLSVGAGGSGEPLTLIGGVRVTPAEPVPLVRDGRGVAGLAGVLGAARTAVTPGTRRAVVEVANFRPGPVRRSAGRLGLRTEASIRYEKGLDTARVDAALDLFLRLLPEVLPGATATGMADRAHAATAGAELRIDLDWLDRRIGARLGAAEILAHLRALGCTAGIAGRTLRVTPPPWRSTGDIAGPEDIVEEVARLHGYDRLVSAPPTVTLRPARSLRPRPLERRVREELAGPAGLREVITYPWTADRLLRAVGRDKDRTVRTDAAPAPDRDSLRPALAPNLLAAVADNLRHRPVFGLFEVGVVFSPGGPDAAPVESTRLGVALAGPDGVALFRTATGLLELLRRRCHLRELDATGPAPAARDAALDGARDGALDGARDADPDGARDADPDDACDAGPGGPAWADRAARLAIRAGGRRVGTLGLVTPRARRLAGIEDTQVALLELDLGGLSAHPSRENRYRPLPELPGAEFDLSVVLADAVGWARVADVAAGAHPLVEAVRYLDEFRGSWVPPGHRSVSLRVGLRAAGSTLTADDIGAARAAVLAALTDRLAARLRD